MSGVTAMGCGDIHMSNQLPHAKPTANGLTDRLEDQMEFWRQFHAEAAKRNAVAELVLGDLFDKSLVDAVTLTHTTRALVGTPCDQYILPGNHDANSVRGGRFTVEAFGAMGHARIKCLDIQPFKLAPWLTFWPVPYMPIRDTRELLKAHRVKAKEAGGVNVLLFHNSITGCKHIGWTCDDGLDGDEVCKGFNWVLSGHFHEHQRFGSKGRGMYLGAPMHHHFGDAGRPAGFWRFNFTSDGEMDAKMLRTRAPRFHKLSSLGDACVADKGDYVRYEIEATHAEWAAIAPDARAVCESLRHQGIRASYKHKPIYHHTERLPGSSKKAPAKVAGLEALISRYVDSSGVVTEGLDVERLKSLGREILEEARRAV